MERDEGINLPLRVWVMLQLAQIELDVTTAYSPRYVVAHSEPTIAYLRHDQDQQ
jgi:hypothetical protein